MSALAGLVDEVVTMLAPIVAAVDRPGTLEDLLALVGADAATVVGAGLLPALAAVKDAVDELELLRTQPAPSLAAVQGALAAVRAAITALRAVRVTASGSALPRLGHDLIALLATTHLRRRAPLAHAFGVLAGVIREGILPGVHAGGVWTRRPVRVEQVDAARLRGMLTDPLATLRAQLPAAPLATRAAADETADLAVERLTRLLAWLGVPHAYARRDGDAAWLGDAAATATHALVLRVPPELAGEDLRAGVGLYLSPADEDDLGVVVVPYGGLTFERELGGWTIALALDGQVDGFAFGGGQGFQLEASPGTAEISAELAIAAASGTPIAIGAAEGTRLELDGVKVDAEARLSAEARTVDLGFRIEKGELIVTGDGGDGFLTSIMGSRALRAPFALGVRYTSGRGLYFEGGAGLSVRVPASVRVGPLTLDEIAVAIEASEEAIRLVAGGRIGVAIGPVKVRVEGAGLEVVATLPSELPARDFDLDARFRAPTGAMLAIEAGPVRGGGLLVHDAAAGRYTGGLALDAMGLALSAVGVLDTAGQGWSLAAVIAAQFAPVQIGFGFTLSGVGGLIGIHRRVDVEALRAALRGPGVGDIFFAADPVAQVARLAGDLGRYFPPAQGRHVIGPAVKLGWGTPGIVEAELGVLLEVPHPVRVALVGSAKAALPSLAAPIVVLAIDVVGEIDFAQRRAAIDATLRPESEVAGFKITGDLAMRLAWGDAPGFVLSVGGFHSQYPRPVGFPELARVRIPIGSGEDPRLDVTGFLALTSNTVQVGAAVALYASAGPLNVTGDVGFEALFELSPFEFRADLSASVKLRRNTRVLASVWFSGTLTGPRPYHVQGEACLSLLLTDLCVDFAVSFGNDQPVELPRREVWPPVRDALQAPASWSEGSAAGALRAVTVAPPLDEDPPVHRIDPGAALAVRQTVAPLERRLTRFAQGTPIGPSALRVTELRVGGVATPFAPITDWFAPAQFEMLGEPERLSRPGYEKMVAGVTAAGAVVTAGSQHTRALVYDTVLVTGEERAPAAPYPPTAGELSAAVALSAHARPPLRLAVAGAFAPPIGTPPYLTLEEEACVIASTEDLSLVHDLGGRATRGEAELALAALLASSPASAGTLQVVPSFEAVAP